MPDETLAISLPNGTTVSAALTRPAKKARWLVVYAPGAGSNVYDPYGRFLAQTLAEQGIATLRIQFPYQKPRRAAPTHQPSSRRRGAPRSTPPARRRCG
jgi:hypothetical protein